MEHAQSKSEKIPRQYRQRKNYQNCI
jgi:hypothetical protein